MRHLAVLLSALTLIGCATKPPVVVNVAELRTPCTNGILALYFKDEAATLRSRVSLEWPARALEECPGVTFKAIGLPPPSTISLQGQRAETLVQALQSYGIPRPAFELGDANDQARPVLEVLASPDR